MAKAMAAGKAVDARKVSHFFPRWRTRIAEREALGWTPMDDKIVGASDLWGGPPGDRFAQRAVERAESGRKSNAPSGGRKIVYADYETHGGATARHHGDEKGMCPFW
jgi:hypothetical protein